MEKDVENAVLLQNTKFNYLIIFVIFYLLGIVAYFTGTIPYFALFLLVIVIVSAVFNKVSYKAVVIFYTIFALGVVNCVFRVKNYDGLSPYIPANATLFGVVETIPTTNNSTKTKFYLKVDSALIDGKSVNNLNARTIVTIYDEVAKYSQIKIADRVELSGSLKNPLTAKNPSQFDYSEYLKNRATFSSFYVKANDWKIVSHPQSFNGKFKQKLNDTRERILKYQSKYLKPNNLEVLGGIVFGDDAINPPDDIKNSFINSGLLHILAASGMNVSIIFGIWYFIGLRLRMNYRLNILIGALLVVFYTLMTGMGPSVLRAALMIEFVLFGKLINRATDSISLIFFVAFLMLLYNPTMICDVGFQLSFVVTFALLFFCPPVLGNIKNKFLNFILGAVFIPFVAQLWASPIQMFYFNSYATYSVFANFAIVPFVMVISFLGFVGSIFAMLQLGVVSDFLCSAFAFILNPVVTALIKISNYFASLPYSLLETVHPNIAQLCLYYTALLLFGVLLHTKFRYKKLVILFFSMLIVFCLSFIKIAPQNCEIIIFDVGNADSFLIKTPKKKYIMIDTAHGLLEGSNAAFSQADAIMNKYMKDNGIRKLDLLLLTHFDSDHSGGAVDVMKSVSVKKIVWNKIFDDSKTTKALFDFVKKSSIDAIVAENNSIIFDDGDCTIKTFVPNFTQARNDNDTSIISLLTYGDFDILFMADGGILSFENIKSDLGDKNTEILKSGHHGARYTVSNSMLKVLKPDSVIISTGLNNYGHPHKTTLSEIKTQGVRVFRTDLDNAIKIVAGKASYRLYTYNTQKRMFVKKYQANCRK